MKKLFLSILLTTILMVPGIVNAAGEESQIGTTLYGTLSEAIANANAGDEITLLKDVVVTGSTLKINKNLTIDMNNHSISRADSVIEVQGATLTLKGTGEVVETAPDYGAIVVRGSEDSSKTNYTVVNVGENVKLTGWAGINIQPINKSTKPYAYGVVVNINGKIASFKDQSNVTGSGVYVNGFIQHEENAPIINLNSTASIESTGAGVYLAGNAILNVNGASITGIENAIGAKAGIITVKEGSVLTATGPDMTPTITYGNGINASGAAIQIESNTGYAGKVKLNIEGGEITSENGYAIYEYLDKANGTTAIEEISISGGNINSKEGKDNFEVSEDFVKEHKEFITGGTFSSDPSEFVNEKYVAKDSNGNFVIGTQEEMKQETKPETNKTPTTEEIENPDTADNVFTYVALSVVSFASILMATIVYRKKLIKEA